VVGLAGAVHNIGSAALVKRPVPHHLRGDANHRGDFGLTQRMIVETQVVQHALESRVVERDIRPDDQRRIRHNDGTGERCRFLQLDTVDVVPDGGSIPRAGDVGPESWKKRALAAILNRPGAAGISRKQHPKMGGGKGPKPIGQHIRSLLVQNRRIPACVVTANPGGEGNRVGDVQRRCVRDGNIG
jgi:hypothetical protein